MTYQPAPFDPLNILGSIVDEDDYVETYFDEYLQINIMKNSRAPLIDAEYIKQAFNISMYFNLPEKDDKYFRPPRTAINKIKDIINKEITGYDATS